MGDGFDARLSGAAGSLAEERFREPHSARGVRLVDEQEPAGELGENGPGRDHLPELLLRRIRRVLRVVPPRHLGRTTRALGIKGNVAQDGGRRYGRTHREDFTSLAAIRGR